MNGKLEFIKAEGKTLSYKRYDNTNEIIVLFNLESTKKSFDLPGNNNYTNLLDNATIKGKTISLQPLSAVILRRNLK